MFLRVMVLLTLLSLGHLLAPRVSTLDYQESYPIKLIIYNSISNDKNLTFSHDIAYRGILLGALKTLRNNNKLNFTAPDTIDYGPYLESVNGVAANTTQQTYWELLDQLPNGTIIRPDVGIGCFIPNPNDTVILKFTTWKDEEV